MVLNSYSAFYRQSIVLRPSKRKQADLRVVRVRLKGRLTGRQHHIRVCYRVSLLCSRFSPERTTFKTEHKTRDKNQSSMASKRTMQIPKGSRERSNHARWVESFILHPTGVALSSSYQTVRSLLGGATGCILSAQAAATRCRSDEQGERASEDHKTASRGKASGAPLGSAETAQLTKHLDLDTSKGAVVECCLNQQWPCKTPTPKYFWPDFRQHLRLQKRYPFRSSVGDCTDPPKAWSLLHMPMRSASSLPT